jgi:hypothetical protein
LRGLVCVYQMGDSKHLPESLHVQEATTMLDDPIHDTDVKANYERIKRLYEYSYKIVDVLIRAEQPQGSYKGAIGAVYMRAYYCLSSLAKLDRPGDFQAVRGQARTLFELFLDLRFLKDNTDSYIKYHKFNKLGHMKSALELTEFIVANPSEHHEVQYFGELDTATDPDRLAECKTLLMTLYGRNEGDIKNSLSGSVPPNWTGMNQLKRIQQLDLEFLEYFKTEVCQSNWYVHGGAVGIGGRSSEMFACIWSRGHELSYLLLRAMTYIAFEELQLLDSVPELETTLRSFG